MQLQTLVSELEQTPSDKLEALARSHGVRSLNPSRIAKALLEHAEMPVTTDPKTFSDFTGDRNRILGTGAYGNVYGTSKSNAVKEIKISKFNSTEPTIMEYLRIKDDTDPSGSRPHPNISSCNYVYLDNQHAKISMPIATGDLEDFNGGKIDRKLRPAIYYQLLRGLAYMHSKDVWHLDIKPPNVLTFNSSDPSIPNVQLADFGLAKLNGKSLTDPEYIVTWPWRAPELFLGETEYTELVDVWSIGIMLLNNINDTIIAHKGYDDSNYIESIVLRIGRPTNPTYLSVLNYGNYDKAFVNNPNPSAVSMENSLRRKLGADFDPVEYDLVSKMLAWPESRISAYEALHHPYFDEVRDTIPEIPDPQTNPWPLGDYFRPVVLMSSSLQDLLKIKPAFRDLLVGWLYAVSVEEEVTLYTLVYAYALLDYIFTEFDMSVLKRSSNKLWGLQGYGIMALSIAIELYSDAGFTVPITADRATYLCAHAYTESELNEIKAKILTHFEFKLSFPTVGDHFRRMVVNKIAEPEYRHGMLIAAKIMTTKEYFLTHRDRLEEVALQAIKESGCALKPEFKNISPARISYGPDPKTIELDTEMDRYSSQSVNEIMDRLVNLEI